METLNSEDLLDLWKNGKTLYAASHDYTNYELKKAYRHHLSELNSENKEILEGKRFETGGIANIFLSYNNSLSLNRALENAQNDLKWDLLNNILSEKLIGVGYEAPIKTSDYPQIIPLHVWPRRIKEINWDESSFSKDNIGFLNIRVIKRRNLKISTKRKKFSEITKTEILDKKPGRPSLRAEIIQAYEHLKARGVIDYTKSLKSHTKLIQEAVWALHPEITSIEGMQYEAIRRALSVRFKADRQNL